MNGYIFIPLLIPLLTVAVCWLVKLFLDWKSWGRKSKVERSKADPTYGERAVALSDAAMIEAMSKRAARRQAQRDKYKVEEVVLALNKAHPNCPRCHNEKPARARHCPRCGHCFYGRTDGAILCSAYWHHEIYVRGGK